MIRGKRRALVAAGNSILTIAHRLLSDPAARFSDLGPDWHDRIAPLRRKRQLIAELEPAIRQEGPAPRRRRMAPHPSGTAARPAKLRFSIQSLTRKRSLPRFAWAAAQVKTVEHAPADGAPGSELQLTVIGYELRGDEFSPLAELSLWGARAAVGLN
jgi:hypothetical protein